MRTVIFHGHFSQFLQGSEQGLAVLQQLAGRRVWDAVHAPLEQLPPGRGHRARHAQLRQAATTTGAREQRQRC